MSRYLNGSNFFGISFTVKHERTFFLFTSIDWRKKCFFLKFYLNFLVSFVNKYQLTQYNLPLSHYCLLSSCWPNSWMDFEVFNVWYYRKIYISRTKKAVIKKNIIEKHNIITFTQMTFVVTPPRYYLHLCTLTIWKNKHQMYKY